MQTLKFDFAIRGVPSQPHSKIVIQIIFDASAKCNVFEVVFYGKNRSIYAFSQMFCLSPDTFSSLWCLCFQQYTWFGVVVLVYLQMGGRPLNVKR